MSTPVEVSPSSAARAGRVSRNGGLSARVRKRNPNPRLVKIHRNYTVDEVASLFGIHRNTVRDWVKRGLPTTDGRRPMLILGRDLAAFLSARRARNKRTCEPGELYCVRCRAPRTPAGGMVDYVPLTPTQGSLEAICSSCGTMIYRRVSLAKLAQACGNLEVTMPKALSHIGESAQLTVNSDLK